MLEKNTIFGSKGRGNATKNRYKYLQKIRSNHSRLDSRKHLRTRSSALIEGDTDIISAKDSRRIQRSLTEIIWVLLFLQGKHAD
jgi:hypothetical protein